MKNRRVDHFKNKHPSIFKLSENKTPKKASREDHLLKNLKLKVQKRHQPSSIKSRSKKSKSPAQKIVLEVSALKGCRVLTKWAGVHRISMEEQILMETDQTFEEHYKRKIEIPTHKLKSLKELFVDFSILERMIVGSKGAIKCKSLLSLVPTSLIVI